MTSQAEKTEITDAGAQDAKRGKSDKIDFKMVTFSLAGKEYGIDIMSVKEIAHAGKFTYVPNAAPFVRGVYNLRGDIISVIDLRMMFHLQAERKSDDSLESLLILRVVDNSFGVIVDNIDKVVGISSAGIQPPHPIFGDINVKYIKGIIENEGKLYIILNVDKLFAHQEKQAEEERLRPLESARIAVAAPQGSGAKPAYAQAAGVNASSSKMATDVNMDFVRENLFTFRKFSVTGVNDAWFKSRYAEWKASRKGKDVQLKDPADADAFLESFFSESNGMLWLKPYFDAIKGVLQETQAKVLNVWNPGCGKGFESYSLACVLRKRYPDARLKVWANDSDLLAISMAPSMYFDAAFVPEVYRDYLVQGKNGFSFNQEIKDAIFFEFHDVLNSNPIPPADVIVCRDTLSFLKEQEQNRLLADFGEKAKSGCLLVLGKNERAPEGWKEVSGAISAYVKGA